MIPHIYLYPKMYSPKHKGNLLFFFLILYLAPFPNQIYCLEIFNLTYCMAASNVSLDCLRTLNMDQVIRSSHFQKFKPKSNIFI